MTEPSANATTIDETMPQVEPDPLPTRWDYHLKSNFTLNGQPAEWAQGSPQHWGSEELAIEVNDAVSIIALSQDDKCIAIGLKSGLEIYEIDGEPIRRLSIPSSPEDWVAVHIEWNRNQLDDHRYQIVVCYTTPRVLGSALKEAVLQVYNLDTQEWKAEAIPQLNINCFKWPSRSLNMINGPSNRFLVLSRDSSNDPKNNCIESWDLSERSRICQLPKPSKETLWLSLNPSGSLIGIASLDQTLSLFDTQSGLLKSSTPALGGQIHNAKFSPDGTKIACAHSGTHPSIRIFDMNLQQLHAIDFHFLTRGLAWSPESNLLAYGAQGGHLQIFDYASRAILQNWELEYPGIRPSPLNEVDGVQIVDEGKKIMFTTGMEGGVEVYDFSSNRKWRFQPGEDENEFVRGTKRSRPIWSSRRRQIIVLDGDGAIRFWTV
ncbi:hypothetical protein CB0940_06976 [Cercospora beticola]|uniref:Anaphase-promoting complex subunit 4 WD40 domain-containing protein n=1 Tax=Cercospora beticola TaxID=122368 RepID=A0A2G5H824_CERBT|nr:hypothetical protein CB0940_06976 [Cercospora beticola]PIA88684.1 hypothetical protein CB0940_06976 [Cercospora beticola]WPB02897.1 hypothetical protein RHO25_007533 [Cercospora beticola]CAK1358407.1 unnamed protein product [Cercospora beticola]